MSENRKRNETLTIRITKSEKAAIVRQAKKAGMSLTEYILALSRQLPIYPPPDFSPLLVELRLRRAEHLPPVAGQFSRFFHFSS